MIYRNFQAVHDCKFPFVFIFLFTFSACFMHYTMEIPPNQIQDGKENNIVKKQLPIKLRINRSNLPKSITINIIAEILKPRRDRPTHPQISYESNENYIENYYSAEILSKFKMDERFINHPESNILVEINPLPEKIEFNNDFMLISFYSLFMIPLKKSSYGNITFKLIDLNQKETIKVYTYQIDHTTFQGVSMFLFSPFIPLFSDYIDHSSNERTFSIMRRAYEAFNRDMIYDLSRDPKLLERFYINDSPNYSLQVMMANQENEFQSLFHSSMESALISKGFQIFEVDGSNSSKTKIDRMISIENLSYERKGNGNQTISDIKYDAICMDSKSDKIFWKQTVTFKPNQKVLSDVDTIQNSVQELFNLLSQNGDI
ncbi:hypothetical protein [Leptospira biflexa]|uniref:hypothetical protein n=2 Tax=Leptospira biflexa TaxID=172 RepID=UPI0010916974|nr:hypothetical protein [Leptospira biflexa]TGM35018.1 hypothetical protein EHQ89_11050 [Leptospira biflexa]TGM54715.1 hypothetical protein EHQ91_07045 [Leptospira biflexa]